MAKKYLGRTAILGIRPQIEKIDDIPGWEGYILIRELTPADVRKITALREEDVDALDISICYLICSVCDEDGQTIFTLEDSDRLIDQLGYAAVTHITDIILRFNDLLDDEDEEEAVGNESS